MVVCVGCDLNLEKVCIYDSETKEIISVDFDTEDSNEKNEEISSLFKCLKNQLNDKLIETLSIVINKNSDNSFRKIIIQAAENQNVKTVRFMEWEHLLLCSSIERLSISPKPYDLLFIFLFIDKEILLKKASFDENNGWEFYGSSCQERSGESDFEDFTKLKETLPNIYGNPYVCVFSLKEIDEAAFKTVFSEYKKIEFEYHFKPTSAALNYARYISNEDGFEGYKINMILTREILLRHTSRIPQFDKTYCKIPADVKLPFTITFQDDASWFIQAYEDGNNYSVEEFPVKTPGKNNITLSIDVNGIYSVESKKVFEFKNSSIAEPINIPPKCSKYRSDIRIIGIDLGTTKFCACVIEKNGSMLMPILELDAFGEDEKLQNVSTMLPSKVICNENGEDKIAIDENCNNFFYDSKLLIGKKFDEIQINPLWSFQILNLNNEIKLEFPGLPNSITRTLQEITAVMLKHIKQTTKNYNSAVISIPSAFDNIQMKAIAEAARLAEWDVIHFIPEPIAAAFAYFSTTKISNNSNILIINLGGGFLDICVAKVSKNQMKILSLNGFENLGGNFFDQFLCNYILNILKREFKNEEVINTQHLLQKCREIKHTLSTETEALLNVRDLEIQSDKDIKITRTEFETLSKELLVIIRNAILSVLQNLQLQNHQLNYVFYSGGGCYMPMIKGLLHDIFPNANHQCSVHPDEIVAKGAALYAYYLETCDALPTWKRWALNTALFFDASRPEYW